MADRSWDPDRLALYEVDPFCHECGSPVRFTCPTCGPRRRSVVDLLDGEQLGGMVGVDALGGSPVLVGQPVVGEVQVDSGRLDRGVSGLGLDRLELHAGLTEPGEAGVAELMAGGPLQSDALARGAQDRVDPISGERLAPGWALEGHEDPVCVRVPRSFAAEVVADRGEQRVGDRDHALVAALALSDEQRPFRDLDVGEGEAEDLAAAT
jgi:hypothetical protein